EVRMSGGGGLFAARRGLRSLGYIPDTSVLPDPGQPLLVARVSWGRRAACTRFEQRLFGQVRQRRTHRGGFDLAPLPAGLLASLREGAARYGAMLRIVADEGRRAALAAAVQEAGRAHRLDREPVAELLPRPRAGPPPTRGGAAGG